MRSAMSARTIRTRSSPRSSRNDILSSTDRATSVPARHEVPERPDAAPGLEPLADRGRHVGLRLADGIAQSVAARETGGDRGGVGAARPVRAGRRQSRGSEPREVTPVPQDIRGGIAQVAALY